MLKSTNVAGARPAVYPDEAGKVLVSDGTYEITAALNVDEQNIALCSLPAGCITLDSQTNLPFSCDLCGGQPQCTPLCHAHCLTLGNNGKADDPNRIRRLASLLEADELIVKNAPDGGGQ